MNFKEFLKPSWKKIILTIILIAIAIVSFLVSLNVSMGARSGTFNYNPFFIIFDLILFLYFINNAGPIYGEIYLLAFINLIYLYLLSCIIISFSKKK